MGNQTSEEQEAAHCRWSAGFGEVRGTWVKEIHYRLSHWTPASLNSTHLFIWLCNKRLKCKEWQHWGLGCKIAISPPFLNNTTFSRYIIFIMCKCFKIILIYSLKSNKNLKVLFFKRNNSFYWKKAQKKNPSKL